MNRTGRILLIILVTATAGCGGEKASSDPATALTSGWGNYRVGEYSGAIKDFEIALSQGDAAQKRQALYALATTWNLRRPDEDPAKARGLYQQLIKGQKDDLSAWSLLALARMDHLVPIGQVPDFAQVRRAYQAVIDEYPGHPAAQEAFVFQQSTWVATLKTDDAKSCLQSLQKFLVDHPESRYRSSVYGLMAACYRTLKQPDERLQSEIMALETREVDVSNPNLDSSSNYWLIATTAEFDAGDFAIARTYYRKLIAEYPVDARVYAATQALKRMDDTEMQLREAKG